MHQLTTKCAIKYLDLSKFVINIFMQLLTFKCLLTTKCAIIYLDFSLKLNRIWKNKKWGKQYILHIAVYTAYLYLNQDLYLKYRLFG